jgi:hypothetical protein
MCGKKRFGLMAVTESGRRWCQIPLGSWGDGGKLRMPQLGPFGLEGFPSKIQHRFISNGWIVLVRPSFLFIGVQFYGCYSIAMGFFCLKQLKVNTRMSIYFYEYILFL